MDEGLTRGLPSLNPEESSLLQHAYRGRKVLVTGHTGFKGAWLALWLSELGARVYGAALAPPTSPNLFELAAVARTIHNDRRADLRSWEQTQAVVDDTAPEMVFHLAAQSLVHEGYRQPRDTFSTNIMGTVNLLEALRFCPSVHTVIVVSSDKCYENKESAEAFQETDPLGGCDPYGASKAATEIICSAYRSSFLAPAHIALATARAGNVIGGGDWAQDRLVPDVVRAIQEPAPVIIRNPEAVRPWQHVLEALHGYLLLGARAFDDTALAGSYNFGPERQSCQPVRILVEQFLENYGGGSWVSGNNGAATGKPEAHLLFLESRKAAEHLKWRPVWNLNEAIQRTSAWYRQFADGADASALCLNDIRDFMHTI